MTINNEPLTLALPAHWLPALVNNDTTGLDDAEAAAFSRWLYDTTIEFGFPAVSDVASDSYFARYHDAAEYGVLACMCHGVELYFHEQVCAA